MLIGTWRVWAGMLMSLVLLASCVPGPGTAGSEPEVDEIPLISEPADIVLPLDAYRPMLDDYVMARRAAWLLTRDCVRRFGAEYTLTEATLLSDLPPLDSFNERRYGLFNEQSAATHGYNVPDASVPPPADGLGWDPSEAELLLVRGGYSGSPPVDTEGNPLPADGCQGEADRLLNDGGPAAPPDLNLGNELNRESHRRSEADSRVRTAINEWSECMARSGYSYSSPPEPNNQEWPEPPGDAEIATASADVACKRETNLIGIWFAVESAYQLRLIEENAEALADVRPYLDAQKRNAAEVTVGR